ncbi:hypothetical protein KEM52_002362 [Ascosphaera acerosa]|nr:hypothetical protein KEM52_002362 [Ascosphaera acerosa]
MHDRMGLQRHTLGIALLMAVVILWTTSNFLASSIFADATFSKPFFMTYLNTSSFTISLLPTVGSRVYRMWRAGQFTNSRSLRDLLDKFDAHSYDEGVDAKQGASAAASRYRDVEALSAPPQPPLRPPSSGSSVKTPLLAKSAVKYASSAASVSSAEDVQVGVMIEQRKLGVAETANIAFQFCLLWV